MVAGAKRMNTKSPMTLIAAFGAALFLAVAPVASAADPVVESAISSGTVGELGDGYLGVVRGMCVEALT